MGDSLKWDAALLNGVSWDGKPMKIKDIKPEPLCWIPVPPTETSQIAIKHASKSFVGLKINPYAIVDVATYRTKPEVPEEYEWTVLSTCFGNVYLDGEYVIARRMWLSDTFDRFTKHDVVRIPLSKFGAKKCVSVLFFKDMTPHTTQIHVSHRVTMCHIYVCRSVEAAAAFDGFWKDVSECTVPDKKMAAKWKAALEAGGETLVKFLAKWADKSEPKSDNEEETEADRDFIDDSEAPRG